MRPLQIALDPRQREQGVSANSELRIIIRAATAWPLLIVLDTRQRVCQLRALNQYQSSDGIVLDIHQRV